MKKLLLLSVLLFATVALAVNPVHADTKLSVSKTIRLYEYQSDVDTGFGIYDIEAYLTQHMTYWETKDGDRTVSNLIATAKLISEGKVVGRMITHSTVVIRNRDFSADMAINQMDAKVTLHGSGQIVNMHMITVMVHGEIVVFHMFPAP